MGLLDANVAQLASSHGSFHEQAAAFHGLIDQAEQTALQAHAVHQGDSSVAFQQAHAQFADAAQKLKQLVAQAGEDIGSAGQTYTAQDGQGASDMLNTLGSIPTTLPTISA